MDKPRATVFIVDDDAEVRRALGRLLNSATYEAREFGSATEFLAAHDPEPAGCIILDLAMGDFGGLEVQASLAAAGCRRPIIFLTGNGSIESSVTAIRAGAVNFLTKPVGDQDLFAAIEEALRIDAAERQKGVFRVALEGRLGTLTPRERQVLDRVVAGRLNKQIAADLGIVEKTTKVHRARVMHKMGARSLAELVRLASVAGITQEPAPRATAGLEYSVERESLDLGPIARSLRRHADSSGPEKTEAGSRSSDRRAPTSPRSA
jgi:FixJ family two-component response regulator